MLRVLLCSPSDLRADLGGTPIGRQGVDLYRANTFDEARLLARTLGCQLVLVDRDMPEASSFIARLRKDDVTRSRSIAVLARGDFRQEELDLLEAGANAILRLPADGTWAERLPKLLSVPVRQEARIGVHVLVDMEPDVHGEIVNLSSGGMLVSTPVPLRLHDEVRFRFDVPTGGSIAGRARVMREAPGAGSSVPSARGREPAGERTGFGLEFVALPDAEQATLGQYLRSARLG